MYVDQLLLFIGRGHMSQLSTDNSGQAELLDALVDAEGELHEAGSRLEMPGTVRLRLLRAAHRAQRLIEAAERQLTA
jgi:hypothetical protein